MDTKHFYKTYIRNINILRISPYKYNNEFDKIMQEMYGSYNKHYQDGTISVQNNLI